MKVALSMNRPLLSPEPTRRQIQQAVREAAAQVLRQLEEWPEAVWQTAVVEVKERKPRAAP